VNQGLKATGLIQEGLSPRKQKPGLLILNAAKKIASTAVENGLSSDTLSGSKSCTLNRSRILLAGNSQENKWIAPQDLSGILAAPATIFTR